MGTETATVVDAPQAVNGQLEPVTEKKIGRQVTDEVDLLRNLGYWLSLVESGKTSEKELGAAGALRFYFARELGLPPLAAAEVSVIKGRLVLGSKLLRALAARHGYRVVRDPLSDGASCTAVLVETGTGLEVGRATFTIDQAKKAGLVKPNSAWENYPDRMLWARASKFVLDDYAPEVTLGIWTDEEARGIVGEPEPVEQDWEGHGDMVEGEIEF